MYMYLLQQAKNTDAVCVAISIDVAVLQKITL